MTIQPNIYNKGITLHFVIREDKKDRHGKSPIFLRITHDRKTSLRSIGLKVLSTEWDKNRGRAKRCHANSVRFNANLEMILQKTEENLLKVTAETEKVTAKEIKENLREKEFISVQSLLKQRLNQLYHDNCIGTYKRYQVVMNKLNKHTNGQELNLHDMDYVWLEKFEGFLRSSLNNHVNTIHATIKVLRAITNEAVRRGDVDVNKNPFLRFTLKKSPTNVTYLTIKELEEIRDLEIDKNTPLYLHQQLFLFASYAGGIRISDLITLKKNQIKDGRIYLIMRKTDKQISFALPQSAIQILNEMNSLSEGEYVFPFLNGKSFIDAITLNKRLSSSNTIVNRSLKIIAKKLGWSKNLHFHMSRHTFATMALSKGIRIEYVSAILGHANIKETQRYAKVGSNELDMAMGLIC